MAKDWIWPVKTYIGWDEVLNQLDTKEIRQTYQRLPYSYFGSVDQWNAITKHKVLELRDWGLHQSAISEIGLSTTTLNVPHLYYNTWESLLVFVRETPDRGRIPTLPHVDFEIPLRASSFYSVLNPDFLHEANLTLTVDGHADKVIPISGTFEQFLKTHSQVARSWKRAQGVLTTVPVETNVWYELQNSEKGRQIMTETAIHYANVELDKQFVWQKEGALIAPPVPYLRKRFATFFQGELFALSDIDFHEYAWFWLNTYSQWSGVGESIRKTLNPIVAIIMQIIEWMMEHAKNISEFNLGIGTYAFKEHFKPYTVMAPGLDFVRK